MKPLEKTQPDHQTLESIAMLNQEDTQTSAQVAAHRRPAEAAGSEPPNFKWTSALTRGASIPYSQ
jgi:hypothetical protein